MLQISERSLTALLLVLTALAASPTTEPAAGPMTESS